VAELGKNLSVRGGFHLEMTADIRTVAAHEGIGSQLIANGRRAGHFTFGTLGRNDDGALQARFAGSTERAKRGGFRIFMAANMVTGGGVQN
jgi:hypothetical protein